MTAQSIILVIVQASIILTVLGCALQAKLQDILFLIRRPRMLLRSLISMNVIMPLLAGLIASLSNLTPAVKIALVAIAISPVPPFLPVKQMKIGGNASYILGLLSTTMVLSIVLVPITLNIFARLFDISTGLSGLSVAEIVFFSVLLPLLIGVLVNELRPAWASRWAQPVSLLGKILLLMGFLPILFLTWPQMMSLIENGTLVAMLGFILVGLAAGHWLGAPHHDEQVVLALSTATRHPGIALAIAQAAYPEEKLAGAAVILYLLVNAIVTIPYMKRFTAPQPKATHVSSNLLHRFGR
jgi:BASS family bile acid:Na+ symporter